MVSYVFDKYPNAVFICFWICKSRSERKALIVWSVLLSMLQPKVENPSSNCDSLPKTWFSMISRNWYHAAFVSVASKVCVVKWSFVVWSFSIQIHHTIRDRCAISYVSCGKAPRVDGSRWPPKRHLRQTWARCTSFRHKCIFGPPGLVFFPSFLP